MNIVAFVLCVIGLLMPWQVDAALACRPLDIATQPEQVATSLIEGRLFVGTTVPAGEHVVSVRVDGRVESVSVSSGHRVEQGDIVLRLAPPGVIHQIQRLEAQVGEAQAAVDKAVAVARSADERLARRRSRPTLFSAEEIAGAEYAVQEADAEIRRTQHTLALVRLELAKSRDDLTRADVTAPVAGIVTRLDVRVGQDVRIDDVLFVVESDTGQMVQFLIPESASAPAYDETFCIYSSDSAGAWAAAVITVSPILDTRIRARIGEARFLDDADATSSLPKPGMPLLLGRPDGAR